MRQAGALSVSMAMASAGRAAVPSSSESFGRDDWRCVLELNSRRELVARSEDALADAIRRGADLRIGTAFRHNEHIDTQSSNPELIQEVADFRVTYLL